jgi:hypothetical protein
MDGSKLGVWVELGRGRKGREEALRGRNSRIASS